MNISELDLKVMTNRLIGLLFKAILGANPLGVDR